MHIARKINELFALTALHELNVKERKTRAGKIRHGTSNQRIVCIIT